MSEQPMDRRVATIIASMKADPKKPVTLRALARSVNLSPTHLCYLFRAETGTTPASYLKLLRITGAAELLSSTFLSVKEVAACVGFGDISHFSRSFKAAYGVTASDFRRTGGRRDDNN